MAKTRKNRSRAVAHARPRKNSHRRRGVARRNPTRLIVMRSRKRNGSRRMRMNPQFFGRQMKVGEVVKVVAGGLVGLGLTKLIVPMLPATLTTNNIAKFASAVVVALAAGFAANKVSNDFGSSVMFGGLMEAASIGLDPYLPITQYTGLSGGRGLRAYVPAQFNEPQNPFSQAALPGSMVTSVYRSPYRSGVRS